MKKVLMSALAIATIATTITSCKKGDEDGGLSLSGRKSRIAGEWTVDKEATDYTTTDKNNGTTVYTDTRTGKSTFEGGSYSSSWTQSSTLAGSGSSNGSSAGSVTSYTMTIEKDGTWKSKKEYKVTSSTYTGGNPATTTTSAKDETITVESEGTWQFLGKNKSLEEKNKESVSFNTTKETTTTVDVVTTPSASTSTSKSTRSYGINENVKIYHLTMLKKKEMKADWEMNTVTGGTNSWTYGGTSGSSTSNDYTYKGTGSMEFSIK